MRHSSHEPARARQRPKRRVNLTEWVEANLPGANQDQRHRMNGEEYQKKKEEPKYYIIKILK